MWFSWRKTKVVLFKISNMRVVFLLCFLSLFIKAFASTAVLILARGGSKGVHLKNLRNVGGKTLLSRSILAAKYAHFKDITISTDNPLIALEALKNGVSIFRRSYVTATDWAPSIWGVQEFLFQRPEIAVLVLLQATSPFTSPEHLKLSLMKLDQPKPYDCIFSVTRSFKLRWNSSGSSVYPINFNYKIRPRRQDWSGEYIETGGFYIIRSHIIQQGFLQNNNCTLWEVSQLESIEIDSELDIYIANILLSASKKIL